MNVWVVMANHIHFIILLGNYGFDNKISSIGNGYDNRNDHGCVDKIYEFYLQPFTYNVLQKLSAILPNVFYLCIMNLSEFYKCFPDESTCCQILRCIRE